MKGIELEKVRDLIVAVFDMDEFDQLLRFKFDFDRENEVGEGPFKKVAFKVLESSEKNGWDPLLIAEVAAARPLREDVQEIYMAYAHGILDAARRDAVSASLQKARERFGLTPLLQHQQGGMQQANVPATDSGLEKLVRPNLPFLNPSSWREQLFLHECRVCRVEPRITGPGTGFLVGPDALLTNYHVLKAVIESPKAAKDVLLRFDYRVLANGLKSDGLLVRLHPSDWLIGFGKYSAAEAKSEPDATPPAPDELDFSLVRLERRLADEPVNPRAADSLPRGWVRVPTAAPAIESAAALLILQHPEGHPIKLVFDTAPEVKLMHGGMRVRYATNTEGGSSGSPVFDADWNLLALHHYGDPARSRPKYNQGVPIHLIRDRLKQQGKDGLLGNARS